MQEKEYKQEKYRLKEIATQTGNVITDGDTDYDVQEALILILNKLDNMEKKIVG